MLISQHPTRRRSACTSQTIDALLGRLESYQDPVPLKDVQLSPPYQPLNPRVFRKIDSLQRSLDPCLQNVVNSAEQFHRRVAELTALDCHFVELVAEQYNSTNVVKYIWLTFVFSFWGKYLHPF